MEEWILISLVLVGLIVIIGLIVSLVVLKKKKEDKMGEPNYQAFFIMGISFLALGIILTYTVNPGFLGFIAIGIIYIAICLANKDKWINKK
jgi:hypothetical protein